MAAQDGATPRVSVVVIGRNEGTRLVSCLESVHSMNYSADAIELVYVDSSSTDDSVTTARRLGAIVVEVAPERPCAAVGRNAGWRVARNEFILFLDGDTILNPDFVRLALAEFNDHGIAVVCGHRRETHPDSSVYNHVLDLDWIYRSGETDFCGGDAMMRRSVLESVGGFDETIIAGEEPELCARIRAGGRRVLHIDVPMTGHDLDIRRFSQYWMRAVRAGHAYREVSERFRGTDTPLWSREARRNILHAGFLLGTTVLAVALSAIWTSGYPLLAYAIFWTAVIVRSAGRTHWKSPRLRTRLMYAVHSHFQQLPILYGQILYIVSKKRGRRQRLIEYKDTTVRG